MNRLPTALLLVLFLGYATVFVRLPAAGFGLGQRFDPFASRPRIVEQMIVANQFAQALPLAVELRRSFPNEPQVISWVAVIHRGLKAWVAEASAWEDYVRLSPTPAAACPALPEAYGRLGKVEQALASYERCAKLDPQNADRLFDLGHAYQRSGRASEAIALYRQAAALDPYNPVLTDRIAALSEGRR